MRCLCIFILLLFGLAAPTSAKTAQQIAKEASKSVVYIKIKYWEPTSETYKDSDQGSGVIVSDNGDILTAYHVLWPYFEQSQEERDKNPLMVRIGSKSSPEVPVEYLGGNPDSNEDYAVLRLQVGRPFKHSDVCYDTDTLKEFDPLFAFGFPGDVELTPVKGTFSNRASDAGRLSAAIAFEQGMSGGPVFNEAGFVIGIIKGAIGGGNTGLTSNITPAMWASDLLKRKAGVEQKCVNDALRNLLDPPALRLGDELGKLLALRDAKIHVSLDPAAQVAFQARANLFGLDGDALYVFDQDGALVGMTLWNACQESKYSERYRRPDDLEEYYEWKSDKKSRYVEGIAPCATVYALYKKMTQAFGNPVASDRPVKGTLPRNDEICYTIDEYERYCEPGQATFDWQEFTFIAADRSTKVGLSLGTLTLVMTALGDPTPRYEKYMRFVSATIVISVPSAGALPVDICRGLGCPYFKYFTKMDPLSGFVEFLITR